MSLDKYLQELADREKPLAIAKLVDLSALGTEKVALFRDAWPEFDLQRRQRLMEELIELAEDNVELNFDSVFLIGLADRDPEVRRSATKGLWEHDGRELIDALLGLLEDDPDVAVRAEAALALGRFVLQAEFGALPAEAAERIAEALRRTVDDEAEATEVRARALESIGARDEPGVRDLIEQAYESAERRLQLSAVHAMGRSCDADWLPALFAELESDDAEMRFEAANACGSIEDEAAVEHLLPVLSDEDEEAQEAAIAALGEIGGAQAREALQELLEEGGERVRESILAALAGTDFAEDPLAFASNGGNAQSEHE